MLLPLVLLAPAGAAQEDPKEDEAKKLVAAAVIVHPKNPVTRLSLHELRAYLKMERQFWPNKKRLRIFLPRRGSAASDIVLEHVYRMSYRKLQRYWVRKLFSGEIPAKPIYVPSARAAGSQVLREESAISVVEAEHVPEGVRVLRIDGKRPGEDGYPLAAKKPEEP